MRVILDEITRLQRASTLWGALFQPKEMHSLLAALDKANSLTWEDRLIEVLCHRAANVIRDLLHQIMELSGERDR